MSSLLGFLGFGKKSDEDNEEQMNMKDIEKSLPKVGRDLDKEQRRLEQEEMKLTLEIRKSAKRENDISKVLAKLKTRKDKVNIYAAKGKVRTVRTTAKVIQAKAKMQLALRETRKAIGEMNTTTNPQGQPMPMDVDMTDDKVDDVFAESGDEEEQDDINKVLDEIGLGESSKFPDVPTDDNLLEARLARLQQD